MDKRIDDALVAAIRQHSRAIELLAYTIEQVVEKLITELTRDRFTEAVLRKD